MTLTDFLLARFAEDEARAQVMWQEKVARRAVGQVVAYNWPTPDRTLAECEAKRRIVELHDWIRRDGRPLTGDPLQDWWDRSDETMRTLALPYAAHPDFRDEWRP